MRRADRDAQFSEFVAARQAHLRRIAFALCGDWHRADDLVQSSLVKLHVAWPRIQRVGNEEAYVRRIMVRTNIDEHRRPWRRERPSEELRDDPTEGREADAVEDRADLVAALQRLPSMQRKVVVLRHWLDLSVRETATELGISEGTVKSHSSRGLARLSTLLDASRRTPAG